MSSSDQPQEPAPEGTAPASEGTVPAAPPVPPQLVPPAFQPAPQAAFQLAPVETEPLEYHRLYRGIPRYSWWKPLVALLLGVIFYFTLQTIYLLVIAVAYFGMSGDPATIESIEALALPDTQQPITILSTLGSVILMIPALFAALWAVGYKPIGRLWSVAGRIRWNLIWRSVLPSIAALVVMNVVGIGLELLWTSDIAAEFEMPEIDATAAMWSALLLIVLLPFQCAAEELVFRGMLLQMLGSWLRSPWVAIVLSAVLFGFSHIYDVWGWSAVVVMALVSGWLTWRTGGLEAAIVLHIVNNAVAFSFMLFGVGGETGQSAEGGGLGSLIGSVIGLVFYAWLIDRSFMRRDGRRTRVDLVWPKQPRRPIVVQTGQAA